MRAAPRAGVEHGGTAAARLEALAVFLSALVLYANSLANGFVYDDVHYILGNPWIRDPSHLPEIFGRHAAGFTEAYVAAYYRPMMHLLYLAVYQAFGPAAWAFHLLNVVLHTATSVLVLAIARRIIPAEAPAAGAGAARFPSAAFVAALLFAAHPVHTESVAWLAGITDLALALFFLLAIYLWMRAREGWRPGTILSAAAFFLAALSKEPALTLPVVLVAHDALIKRPAEGVGWLRGVRTLGAHFVALAVYLALRLRALGGFFPEVSERAASGGAGAEGGLIESLHSLAKYLGMLALPVNLNVVHLHRPPASLLEPEGVLALATLAALAVVAYASRRSAPSSFGLLMLLLPLLPALYGPALGEYRFAERYLYLPSVGFVLLLGSLWGGARRRLPGAAGLLAAAALGLAGLYAVVTVPRNAVWRDSETLWRDAVRKSPASAAAHEFLANALYARGSLREAIAEYEACLSIDPDRPGARINLGAAYAATGRIEEAIAQYEAALALGAGAAQAYNNLGLAYMAKGQVERAVRSYLAAIAADPSFADARNNLGVAYWERGEVGEALTRFEEAARLDPSNETYRENVSKARRTLGR